MKHIYEVHKPFLKSQENLNSHISYIWTMYNIEIETRKHRSLMNQKMEIVLYEWSQGRNDIDIIHTWRQYEIIYDYDNLYFYFVHSMS